MKSAAIRSSQSTPTSIVIYGLTVFLSAFLLFQVQPLMGKFILPWFGGSPAVWTTCMLVFQVLLFAGYAYAHLTSHCLKPFQQWLLHSILLLIALVMLPIAPNATWKPSDSEIPALRIMLLMTVCVGLPYFILSATGPLLQSWFSQTHRGVSPYRLYALSNIGSLLALISYPVAVEPFFSVRTQSIVWSATFALFALLCGGIAYNMWRRSLSTGNDEVFSIDGPTAAPRPGLIGLWFLLAMTPSLLLLASTNQVCMDVAVVPFLWVLPLALYLVTFILCFDSERWYARKPFMLLTVILQLASIYLVTRGSSVSIVWQIAIYFGAFFGCCMVCHGELARLKPSSQHLTRFYLTMSAGGATGGLFVGLIAPMLFVAYYELHVGVVCFMIAYICLRLREDGGAQKLVYWVGPTAVVALVMAVIGIASQLGRNQLNAIEVARNFYGVLKVERVEGTGESIAPMLQLAHGRIAHGSQFIDKDKQRIPTAYYAENTGIGRLMRNGMSGPPRHIGIVGLGIGTLAAYGRSEDAMRLYEINPDVIRMAEENFTFLVNSPASKTIITGDARLALEFEAPQQFDLLVLDAFSGDAIPLHLLTREAMEVYLKHLKNEGTLAVHISNLHFNLRPVIAGLAKDFSLQHLVVTSEADPTKAARPAVWAFLSRGPEPLEALETLAERDASKKLKRKLVHWTDARSNLLEVMW
jgi:spermidine synthase